MFLMEATVPSIMTVAGVPEHPRAPICKSGRQGCRSWHG
jgi:hypothetical protein